GNSGRSLAEIQTAWHNYYVNLSDQEKHAVWQEFYEEHNRRTSNAAKPLDSSNSRSQTSNDTAAMQPTHTRAKRRKLSETRSIEDIKTQLISRVGSRANTKRGGHLKSLMFGLSSGGLVVLLLLFSFFNERF